jgi:hypothetical protein
MRTSPLLPGLLLVLALVLLAGCSRKDPEDVKVTLEDGKLVIVNNSGDDIYYYNNDDPARPWVPASAPHLRIRDGERRTFDIDAPGVREHGVRVNWWHRGRPLPDSDLFGADRVRKVQFEPVAINALLPKPPDPAIEQAAAANLANTCRDRMALEAWAERRARGTEPSASPPDASNEGIPSPCQDIVQDCTAAKQCGNRLAGERRALEGVRVATGTSALAGIGVTPLPSIAPTVANELASVCRDRALLDAWDKSNPRTAGNRPDPPDFSNAAVPWACRDLLRDCEAQKSCPKVLAEQKAQLDEVRVRAGR